MHRINVQMGSEKADPCFYFQTVSHCFLSGFSSLSCNKSKKKITLILKSLNCQLKVIDFSCLLITQQVWIAIIKVFVDTGVIIYGFKGIVPHFGTCAYLLLLRVRWEHQYQPHICPIKMKQVSLCLSGYLVLVGTLNCHFYATHEQIMYPASSRMCVLSSVHWFVLPGPRPDEQTLRLVGGKEVRLGQSVWAATGSVRRSELFSHPLISLRADDN